MSLCFPFIHQWINGVIFEVLSFHKIGTHSLCLKSQNKIERFIDIKKCIYHWSCYSVCISTLLPTKILEIGTWGSRVCSRRLEKGKFKCKFIHGHKHYKMLLYIICTKSWKSHNSHNIFWTKMVVKYDQVHMVLIVSEELCPYVVMCGWKMQTIIKSLCCVVTWDKNAN